MKTRIVAAWVTGSLLAGAAGGVLFEHYLGTNAVIGWAGLRHHLMALRAGPVADRANVPLAAATGRRTMVALVFGQSNAGNSGESPGRERAGVYEFYRGRIFNARDPLLGAEGRDGSVWLRLGARALASGEFDSVILVPFAVGVSEMARWAPGGSLHGGLLSVIADAQQSGLVFTHLLWQHGEADAIAGTSGTAYREGFLAMLAAIRRQGVNAPIYVARASRCGRVRPAEEIRSAQQPVDPASGILAGPDTDTLGFAERYDGCHFSTEGLEHAAELWLDAIRSAGSSQVSR